MKRLLIIFLSFLFLFNNGVLLAQPRLTIPSPTTKVSPTLQAPTNPPLPTSGPRYSACDLCGYCPPEDPPQSWLSCKKCLYPNISNDPTSLESLKIDTDSNLPPTPFPGRQHTLLGCLGGGPGGFTGTGSAGGVVQSALNIIFSAAGGIAFLYLLYGSFIIATSQADPERLNYGKRLVNGAIIGLVFTLGSVLLVNFTASGILKVPGFGESPNP